MLKRKLLTLICSMCLLLVGCSTTDDKDVFYNSNYENDKYSNEFKQSIQLIEVSSDDSIIQNTIDTVEIMIENFTALCDYHRSGNDYGFGLMASTINENSSYFLKVSLDKADIMRGILDDASFSKYYKSLRELISIVIEVSAEMMEVDQVKNYKLDIEKGDLVVEKARTFYDLFDDKLYYSKEYLNKDESIDSNLEMDTSSMYEHSDLWKQLNVYLDNDIKNLFESKYIDLYNRFAGSDKSWSEYTPMTKEKKLDMLNKGAKSLISAYALNSGTLTSDEIMYLEELGECLFSKLLGDEYNEPIGCSFHN